MEISALGESQAVINCSSACDNNETAVKPTSINSAKVIPAKVNSSNSSLKKEGKVINSVCKKLYEKNHSVKNSHIEIKKQRPKKKLPKKLTSSIQNKLNELNNVSNCVNKVESKQKIGNTVAFVIPQIFKPSKVSEDLQKEIGPPRAPKDNVKSCSSDSIVIEQIIHRTKPWSVVDSIRPGTSKDYFQPILPKEPSNLHKGNSQLFESKHSSKPNIEKEHSKHGSSKETIKLDVSKDFPVPSPNRAVDKCISAHESSVPSMSRRKYLYFFRSRSHHVVVKKHGIKVYKCDICSGEYRQNFSLKRHFLRSHVNAKYVSKSDILNCKIREGLLTLDSHDEEPTKRKKSKVENEIFLENNDNRAMPNLFKCHICSNVTFDLEKEIRAHYKRQHSEGQKKKFSCDTCGAIFVRKQFLIKHRATHRPPAFECRDCDIHFSSKSEYKKHALSHSNNKSVCRTCLKTFSSTANRKRHEKLHQGPIRTRGRGKQPKKPESSIKQSPSKPPNVPVVQPLKVKICPVCKKAFSTYLAMMKHRSKKHPILSRRRRTQRPHVPKVLTKKDLAALARKSEYDFYCNVSQRIADNLLHYLDGKAKTLSLKKYNFNDHSEPSNYSEDLGCLPWSSFNFPNGFDVDNAVRNRGQEIKQKPPENLSVRERSLYATGLNKVHLSPASSSNCTDSIWSESSNDASETDWHSENCFRNDIKDLSLEEKKKLIGRELVVVCLCTICKESFTSYEEYDKHCENNHPNIECSCIEIEGDARTPPQVPVDLCRQYVNSDGVFFSYSVPPPLSQTHLLKCTKCKTEFSSSMELHKHILDCGGNECAVAKYVRTQRKRIKRTMKNRMDLSAKLSPAKRLNHFYKNGRLQTASMKCDKNYFSTKPLKQMKSTVNLKQKPPLKQKVECPTCKRAFRSEVNLKSHVILCFKRTFSNRKAQSNNHNSKTKVNHVIPAETHAANNESLEPQKTTLKYASNYQNIPGPYTNSSLTKTSSAADSSDVSNGNSCIPNSTGAEETAVDLSVKSQVCAQKSAINTLSVPKPQTALDKAMEAATEFAKSMPKVKKMSPISSLSETVKRLTKQLSGRTTGLETFNLDISPPKKSPRKQIGPSGCKTAAPESLKNDPKCLKKVEDREKENICNSDNLHEKVRAESALANKPAPESVKSPSHSSSNSDKLLNRSEILITPEKKLQKSKIKTSSGVEGQTAVCPMKVAIDASKISSPVKADPPKLQCNATEDTLVVSSPDNQLKNKASIGNTDIESKKKDFPVNTTEHASKDANGNADFEPVNGSLNETASSNAHNKSDASFSSIDLSDTQSDNGSTDKFPALSNSVLFLPAKKQTKSRSSSGSQGRISPSLESIVNSIKQKLHSQELDPEQQCVSWLEDEKFVIPSSSPKLRLPVSMNSTSDPLAISKRLDFQAIEVNNDSSEASKTPGSDSVLVRDAETESSSVTKSAVLSETPAPTELSSIHLGGSERSDALSNLKEPSVDTNFEEIRLKNIEISESSKKGINAASVKKNNVQDLSSAQTLIPSVKSSTKISKVSKKMSKTDSSMDLVPPNSVSPSAVPKQKISSDITLAKRCPKSLLSFDAQENSSQINSSLSDAATSVPPNELKKTSINAGQIVRKEVLDSSKVSSCEKAGTVAKSCKSSFNERNVPKMDGNSRSVESIQEEKGQTASNLSTSLPTKLFDSSKADNHSHKKDANSRISNDDVAKMEKSGSVSIKRKGRPPKNLPKLQVAPKPKLETETAVIKRKPGRPFKRKRGRRGLKHSLDESLNSSVTEISNKSEDKLVSSSAQIINQNEEKCEKDDADKNRSSDVNSSKKTDAAPEVRTIFGLNLASKMKEKMRQSFKSASTEKPASTDLSSNSVTDAIEESATNNDTTTFTSHLSAETDSINSEELPLDSEADVSVKMEQEFKEDAKKHFCPFCLGEFAYLTNYRRHLKICKERLNSRGRGVDLDSVPQSSSGLLQFLPKKDEVESSMLDLARHQSRQSQILKETENTANNKKGFRTYSCRFCHRIYLSLFQFLQHQMNAHKIIKGEVDMESRSDQSDYQAFDIKAEDAMTAEERALLCEDSRYLSEERCDSESSNIEFVTNPNDLESTPLPNMDSVNAENEQELVDPLENRNEQLQADPSIIGVGEESEVTLKSLDVPENENHASVPATSSSESLPQDQTNLISSEEKETTARASTPLADATLDTKAEADSVTSMKDTKNVPAFEFDHIKDLNTTVAASVSLKDVPSKRGRRRRFKGKGHNFVRRKASAANLSKKLKHDILDEKALLLANTQEEKAIFLKGSKHLLLNSNKKAIFHKIKRKFIRKKVKNIIQEGINASETVEVGNTKTETDLKSEKVSILENSAAVVNEPKKEDEPLGKIFNNRTLGLINKKVRIMKKEKKIMKFGMKRTLSPEKLNTESKLIKPRGRPRKEPIAIPEPSILVASPQKIPSNLQKDMTPKRRYMKKSVMFSPPSTSKNHIPSTSFQSKTRNAKGLQSFPPTIDDSSNDDDVAPPEVPSGPPQKKKRAKICPVCKKKFPATLLRNRHIQLIHSRKTPIDIASISPPENLKKKRIVNETANRSVLKRVCRKPSPEKRPKKTDLN